MSVVLAIGMFPTAAFAEGGASGISGSTSTLTSASNALAVSKSKVKLAKCKVKLSKKSYKYTGKRIKAKVKLSYQGKKLKAGKDYTLIYKNAAGKRVPALKTAGKYTLIVKGKGGYKGKVVKKVKVWMPRYIKTEGFKFEKPTYWYKKVAKKTIKEKKIGSGNRGKILVITDNTSARNEVLYVHYCENSRYKKLNGVGNVTLVGAKKGKRYTAAVYWAMGPGSNWFLTTSAEDLATGGAIQAGQYENFGKVQSAAVGYLNKKILKHIKVY